MVLILLASYGKFTLYKGTFQIQVHDAVFHKQYYSPEVDKVYTTSAGQDENPLDAPGVYRGNPANVFRHKRPIAAHLPEHFAALDSVHEQCGFFDAGRGGLPPRQSKRHQRQRGQHPAGQQPATLLPALLQRW